MRTKKYSINKLIEYNKGKEVLFTDINYTFFECYKNYLIGLNLSQNTVLKHFKALRALIEVAIKNKCYNGVNYAKEIKIKEQITIIKALTWAQVLAIENLIFEPHQERLETIRDMFLFSCFTGLRISDLIKIGKHNLKQTDKGTTLNFTAVKTNKPQVLPLYELYPLKDENTTRPLKLISKYITDSKELIFKKYSDQLYNRELKEIGFMAKIDFNLTSHIGRKTLATNLPTLGVNTFVIKDILKHSNIKTTERYVKVGEQQVADELNKCNWK